MTLTVVDRLPMRFAVALIIAGGLLLIGSFVPVSPDFGRDQPALANAASTVKPGFGVKAPLAGLLDRAGPADKPYLSGFVLQVRWADIEPQPGRMDLSRIRAGLRIAAQHGKRVVLRVTAGVDAPAWAQRLGGAPLPFFDHSQGRWLTLGRFWRPDYRREWGRLQARLATAFDADPTLAQVNVCGTGEILRGDADLRCGRARAQRPHPHRRWVHPCRSGGSTEVRPCEHACGLAHHLD